jgi:hypothetical protein
MSEARALYELAEKVSEVAKALERMATAAALEHDPESFAPEPSPQRAGYEQIEPDSENYSTGYRRVAPEPSPFERALDEAASEMANAEFTVAALVERLFLYLNSLGLSSAYWRYHAIELARLAIAWSESIEPGARERVKYWETERKSDLPALLVELASVAGHPNPQPALDRVAAIALNLAVEAEE